MRRSPLNGVTSPESKTLSAEKFQQLPAVFAECPAGCKVGAQTHCTAVVGRSGGYKHLLLMVTRTLHAT